MAAGYTQRDILSFLTSFGYRFEIIGRKGKMRPVTVDTLGHYQNVLCLPPDSAGPHMKRNHRVMT
jgi:hypothetical protein